MADPFQELGISRRPLFQMFGLPEDQGAGSPFMAQAVRNDRITQAAQMKLEQDFADIERRGQAEAAADEFVRQNPGAAMAGSSRFGDIARYQQIQQRGPSYSDAVLSRSLANRLQPSAREKFYQYVNEGRGVNQAYDDAEAEEEDMKLRVGLVEAGVPEDALPPLGERIDPIKAAALRASKKGSSGRDNLDDMNMYAKRLEDDLEGMRKKNMGLDPEQGQEGYDAYAAKMDELGQINQMRDEVLRNRFLKPVETGTQKKIVGAVAEGNAAGASGATPPPAAPTVGFMDTMRKAAKPEDILRVDEKEIIEGVNDPSADENTFMAAIQDPKVSLPVKQQALARLEDYAKNIKPSPTMKARDHFERVKRIQGSVEEGRKAVEMAPVVAEYNKTWDAEKADMSSRVARFAEALGITQEQAEDALRENDALPVRHLVPAPAEGWKRQDTQNPEIPAQKAFELFIAKDLGGKPGDEVLLNKRPDRFLPFEGSKFAGELGMQGPIPGFRSIGKGKNYAEVLDVYLKEKQPPVAGAAEAGTVAAPPKIEIGKPRRIQ